MIQYRLFLILFVAVVSLSGCAVFKPLGGPYYAQHILTQPPEGPPLFQKGWLDGCHTGIATTGSHIHKLAYGFKQDYKLVHNFEYYTGWKVAWSYCQRYIYQYYLRTI